MFYAILSCILLFDRKPYHHHVFMSSAGKVATGVYEAANEVTSYFGLKQINEDLQQRNAALESELLALKQRMQVFEERYASDTISMPLPLRQFDFILGTVINNSVVHPYNYLTVNKGRIAGVEPEMGVVDQNGVIGIVDIVSDGYCRIISLLNPNFRVSCKVKGNIAVGSLVWDGKSPRTAILEELPRHTVFENGDTVVTSGYSTVFPEGIPVGVIIDTEHTVDDNFYTLRIRLLSDFSNLSKVMIVRNNLKDEIKAIESKHD